MTLRGLLAELFDDILRDILAAVDNRALLEDDRQALSLCYALDAVWLGYRKRSKLECRRRRLPPDRTAELAAPGSPVPDAERSPGRPEGV